jgi:hypothetical protein
MMRKISELLLVCVFLVAPAVPAADTGQITFSGTITAIDPQGGVLLLDEIGPARRGGQGNTITRRAVYFTAETKFNAFMRVNAPDRFAGDFIEVALDADSVTPGDFTTVECVRQRNRLVAVRVTLAESYPLGPFMTP